MLCISFRLLVVLLLGIDMSDIPKERPVDVSQPKKGQMGSKMLGLIESKVTMVGFLDLR